MRKEAQGEELMKLLPLADDVVFLAARKMMRSNKDENGQKPSTPADFARAVIKAKRDGGKIN
jgi:hypothetical protein